MAQRKKSRLAKEDRPKELEAVAEERVGAGENGDGTKKSNTSLQKSDNSATDGAMVAVEEKSPSEAEKEKGSSDGSGAKNSGGSKNLPVADGGHAMGPRTVPIRMLNEERRNLLGRIGVLLLIAAVLVGAVLIFMFRPTEYTERTHSVVFLYMSDRDVTVVAVDGEVEGDENGYPGRLTHRADNGKGDVCAAIIGGSLYVVDGGDVKKFGDRVTDCVLAAEGDYVAWRNEEQFLYYAEADDPESTKRATENAPSAAYCLSPNGEELFYTFMGDDGIPNLALISLSGNELTFSEYKNLSPVAVADACEYLYYTDADGALYVLNGKTGERTICGEQPSDLVFNADLSQLLMQNGSESRLFVEGVRFGIDGVHASHRLQLQLNRRVSVLPAIGGRHCLTDSLLDQYYVYNPDSEKTLVYLTEEDDRGHMAEVAYGVDRVTVTDKHVFFLQTVVSPDPRTDLKCTDNGETEVRLCYGNVSDYCTNVDGSRLAYITPTGLYSGKAEEMLEWLSDDVERSRGVDVTCDDAFYYFTAPGELYVSDNGDGSRKLADGVDWFFTDGDTLYYGVGFSDDGIGSVYANVRDSRKSDLLLEGVGSIE
ncbi:MAG: hypothetical protein IKM08_02825 [Clostridia bacterium]|nr:hypothetical protein [Clostridia bacterium]